VEHEAGRSTRRHPLVGRDDNPWNTCGRPQSTLTICEDLEGPVPKRAGLNLSPDSSVDFFSGCLRAASY